MIDFREYENGVADILSFLLGDAATVERNVLAPPHRGRRRRQVDVLVQGRVFGLDGVTLAVDCKIWARPLAVGDIDRFLGFLDDVGTDLGLLMSASGYSAAAKARLENERGAWAKVLTLEELSAWSPPGTRSVSFRLKTSQAQRAAKALRAHGMRVRPDSELRRSKNEIVLTAFGHFGSDTSEDELTPRGEAALADVGLCAEIASTGITIGGGTPAHRWLEVTGPASERLGLKVLVGTEEEVEQELTRVANTLGLPRARLGIERPHEWPVTGRFGLPQVGKR
jgi:hypothetical protein